MKKTALLTIIFSVIFLVALAGVQAEMAKEGSMSGTTYWITKFNIFPMGKEIAQINYEGWGIAQSDTGEGITHNASCHVVGGLIAIKGVYENDSGLVSLTRPDGDQIFLRYKTSGVAGKTGKGTLTYVGGTGKFAGIQGTGEFSRIMLRPPAKGFGASLSVTKSNWKIVEPEN